MCAYCSVLTGRGRVRGGASFRRRPGQSPGPLTLPLPAKRRGEEKNSGHFSSPRSYGERSGEWPHPSMPQPRSHGSARPLRPARHMLPGMHERHDEIAADGAEIRLLRADAEGDRNVSTAMRQLG